MNCIFRHIVILLCLSQTFCINLVKEPNKISIRPAIESVSIISKDDIWIVTEKGKGFHFRASEKKTTEIKIDSLLLQIFFLNPKEGWILDGSGLIWVTNDGGTNWVTKNSIENKVSTGISPVQLIFSDIKTGWIVEGFGIWQTKDGGTSWDKILPNNEITLGQLESQPKIFLPINNQQGWVGMINGRVLKTRDDGKSWEIVNLPQNSDVQTLFSKNETECWAGVGSGGGLFQTIDGGKTWQQVLEDGVKANIGLSSIDFSTDKNGWAVGMEFAKNVDSPDKPKGVVLKTQDGGKTWSRINLALDEIKFNKIKFFDEKNGWLVGEKAFYKTDDGGKVWNKVFELKDVNPI
jgi:photosystem II stability/assembly factor-like uncharacterized protein